MMLSDDDEVVVEPKIDETVIQMGFDQVKQKVGQHTKNMVDKIFKAVDKDDKKELDSLFQRVEKRAQVMCTSKGSLPNLPRLSDSGASLALKALKEVVNEKNKKQNKREHEIALDSSAMSKLTASFDN